MSIFTLLTIYGDILFNEQEAVAKQNFDKSLDDLRNLLEEIS